MVCWREILWLGLLTPENASASHLLGKVNVTSLSRLNARCFSPMAPTRIVFEPLPPRLSNDGTKEEQSPTKRRFPLTAKL